MNKIYFFLIFLSAQAQAAQQSTSIEVFCTAKVDYSKMQCSAEERKYPITEDYVDKPVFKISSFAMNGEVRESRMLDFVDRTLWAKCLPGAGPECTNPKYFKTIDIGMKNISDVSKILIYRDNKVLAEVAVKRINNKSKKTLKNVKKPFRRRRLLQNAKKFIYSGAFIFIDLQRTGGRKWRSAKKI